MHSPQMNKNKSHARQNNITEIYDLQHTNRSSAINDYGAAMRHDPQFFARKEGMFTNLYNSAHRLGDDSPFRV